MKQRSTIHSLRREADEKAVVVEPAVQSPEIIVPSNDVREVVESVVPAAPLSASSPTSSPVSLDMTSPEERNALQAQVEQLQAELARTKELLPERDDAKAHAYVSAGTWANVDLQTRGITKIIITGKWPGPGHFSQMTIKAWGACLPVNCEWPEVPFYMLDRADGPRYYRGFAIWEHESGARTYLLITFEKSGLRVDKVRFRSEKNITPYSDVVRMKRIP